MKGDISTTGLGDIKDGVTGTAAHQWGQLLDEQE
jgi:hypothetical protein